MGNKILCLIFFPKKYIMGKSNREPNIVNRIMSRYMPNNRTFNMTVEVKDQSAIIFHFLRNPSVTGSPLLQKTNQPQSGVMKQSYSDDPKGSS